MMPTMMIVMKRLHCSSSCWCWAPQCPRRSCPGHPPRRGTPSSLGISRSESNQENIKRLFDQPPPQPGWRTRHSHWSSCSAGTPQDCQVAQPGAHDHLRQASLGEMWKLLRSDILVLFFAFFAVGALQHPHIVKRQLHCNQPESDGWYQIGKWLISNCEIATNQSDGWYVCGADGEDAGVAAGLDAKIPMISMISMMVTKTMTSVECQEKQGFGL